MTESAEKEPAEEREHSFLASFSQADLRLFLITFAGTVAANVVTVMVVAVALIVARPQLGGRPTVGAVLTLVGFAAIGVVMVGRNVTSLLHKRPRDTTSRTLNAPLLTLTVILGLITSEIVLILLGLAVGVK
jgi:hypothetical protein